MLDAIQVILLVLFSSVKFLFAPATVYLSGYNYWETLVITIVGGILGVIVFYYTGAAIFTYINDRFSSGTKKKSFNKRNRLLIKVKSSWGIIGLAIITPCIVSIPFGSLLAARYFRNDPRTVTFLISAVIMWSLILTSATALIGPLFE